MNRCFATIVSANYLAYACVLRDSLKRHAPAAELEVLVVDRPTPEVRAAVEATRLRVTFAEELQVQGFERIAYKFDVVELNTALKPTFLKRLLQRWDAAVYLDPDICLFAAPAPVDAALAEHEIVLTPHSLAPVMDGLRPSDIDYLRQGVFNLGFIAVKGGTQSKRLLDWWEARCLGLGYNDFGFGIFVDQKWMDLAPCYFDGLHVLKHAGCNVAYWNLHERPLSRQGETLLAGKDPLVFFHFSGVDMRKPEALSKHQNRHHPEPGSLLSQLVAQYCAALAQARHADYARLPYGYGVLDDGSGITPLMRRAITCMQGLDESPFNAGSALQDALRQAGMVPRAPGRAGERPSDTLNFDATDRRVVWANRLVRLASRLLGAERVGMLLRYATFLAWRDHFPAVLLKKPFDLRHRDHP